MPIPVPPTPPPGITVTSQDIIKAALRSINVLANGESLSAADGQDALVTMNQMMDSWQAQQLMLYSIQRQVFDLSGGNFSLTDGQYYTMGPGGDFNTTRPSKIYRISVINLNNSQQPLELPLDYITDAQWQNIPVKDISSALPQVVYDTGDYPLRKLFYWPVPNQFPVKTAIYTPQAISQFADLGSTQYMFPPGYLLALRYNLALYLAPEYGALAMAAANAIAPLAESTKAVLMAINEPIVDLRCDPALTTTQNSLYNWITDMPVRR